MSKVTDRIYAWIEGFWKRNQTMIAIAALVFLFLLLFFWNHIAVSVYAGQQGVLWDRFSGTVIDDSYDEGFHLIWPWNEMTLYNLRVQEKEDSIVALTIDGMQLTVRFSVLYRPLKSELGYIHLAVGPEYYPNLLHPITVSSIRQVVGTLRTEEIVAMPEDTLLAKIQRNIHSDHFRVQYENYETGEIVTTDTGRVLPRDIDQNRQVIVEDLVNIFQVNVKIHTLALPKDVQAAINQKLVHEQMEESYAFRLSREEKEKQRKIIEAEGIQEFESISGVSILSWRGIEATEAFAESDNSKIIIIGTEENELPILLNGETR